MPIFFYHFVPSKVIIAQECKVLVGMKENENNLVRGSEKKEQ